MSLDQQGMNGSNNGKEELLKKQNSGPCKFSNNVITGNLPGTVCS